MKSALLFLLLFFFSCTKEKSCEKCIPSYVPEKIGLLYYTGPVAGDGCEWVIRIDNVTYSPDNLDFAFQQTDLSVAVKFKLTGAKFACGFRVSELPVIHLTSIKKI